MSRGDRRVTERGLLRGLELGMFTAAREIFDARGEDVEGARGVSGGGEWFIRGGALEDASSTGSRP